MLCVRYKRTLCYRGSGALSDGVMLYDLGTHVLVLQRGSGALSEQ